MNEEKKPTKDPSEISENLSDERHGVSEEFLGRVEDAPKDERSRPRRDP